MIWRQCRSKACLKDDAEETCEVCGKPLLDRREQEVPILLNIVLHRDGHWQHICASCTAQIAAAATAAMLGVEDD